MRSQIKSPLTAVKYSPACAMAVIALGSFIMIAGCSSGPQPTAQPGAATNQQAALVQNRTAMADSVTRPQPTVATNQQIALVQNGTVMASPASGQSVTKSNQTPSVVYKNRLYFFCCQSHMRRFCASPEQFVSQVQLPNGMDIRGAKPPATAAVTPTHKNVPDPNTIYDIAVGASPVRGADDAPVTIVEFADMQCSFCIREWPKLRQILDEYPEKVRLVFKHFPLSIHKKAKPAHAALELALREGGGETFWKMHDLIVSSPTKLDPSDLRVYAKSLKLDMGAFDAVLADRTKINELIGPALLEARKYGVRGTPTVFINGRRLTSRTMAAYKARIDQILNGPGVKG